MIAIGNNKLKKRYITDSNGNEQEAKKVYIGTNLVHLHMQDNNNPFSYRITNDGKIGEAVSVKGEISNIKGNTISWNQLQSPASIERSKTSNGVTYTNDDNGSVSVIGEASSDSAFAIKQKQVFFNGHSFLFKGCPKNGSASSYSMYVSGDYDYGNGIIIQRDTGSLNIQIQVSNGAVISSPIVFRPMCFDLTLIYGAGNEPTTVTQFEADYERWFGKPLTYEPYNAGELIPAKTTAIKTIGFNQWDEEWEVGYINSNTGAEQSASDAIRSKNYIDVFPSTTYYIKTNYTLYLNRPAMSFYDANKVFINGYVVGRNSVEFTTPAKASYMRFGIGTIVPTYNNDICINLSCTRNGTYEPYESHTLQLPITTLTGKLNGEGESVIVFPDGMKKAGSVQDEIYISGGKTYAVKRVGSVDLGKASWELFTRYFRAWFSGYKEGINMRVKQNCICSNYPTKSPYDIYQGTGGISTGSSGVELNSIIVRDQSYSDAATFKSAMQGVILYYELATPLIYELDDFELPKNYIANGLGTEELLPANDTTLITAPADMTIDYTLN